eukprot:jgi/Ulvmu1/11427/UM076_0001.1
MKQRINCASFQDSQEPSTLDVHTQAGGLQAMLSLYVHPGDQRTQARPAGFLQACAWLALLLLGTPCCTAQMAGGGGPGEGDLRLTEGDSGPGFEYGRLEVFQGGRWGNICQGGTFTPDSAQVACRQLGYDGGARLDWLQPFGGGFRRNLVLGSTAPIVLSDVDCIGSETRLLDCEANTATVQICSDDVQPRTDRRGIVLGCTNAVASCNTTATAEEGSLRLRGGFGTPCDQMYTGFVEVFHNNEWGAVIDGRATLAVDVACRQLGFPHGNGLDPRGEPGSGPPPAPPTDDYGYSYDYSFSSPGFQEEAEPPVGRVWLSGVQCNGPETRLIDCELGRRGVLQQIGTGRSRSGRLTVVCRQYAVEAALEAVTIAGAEQGDLRLVNRDSIDNWVQGRLEVFFEGSWSQVCSYAFDAPDANVACRQLGFGAGTVLSEFAEDAARPQPNPRVYPEVAISKPGCDGAEDRLLDCPVDQRPDNFIPRTDQRGCYSSSDPGLYLACVAEPLEGPAVEEGAIRLVRQMEMEMGTSVSGVLEIFHAGAWGTVCDGGANFLEVISEAYNYQDYYYTGLNPSAGNVACQELGFSGGEFEAVARSMMDDNRSPPWADALLCIGTEERLRDCDGINFGDTVGCEETQRLVCTQ